MEVYFFLIFNVWCTEDKNYNWNKPKDKKFCICNKCQNWGTRIIQGLSRIIWQVFSCWSFKSWSNQIYPPFFPILFGFRKYHWCQSSQINSYSSSQMSLLSTAHCRGTVTALWAAQTAHQLMSFRWDSLFVEYCSDLIVSPDFCFLILLSFGWRESGCRAQSVSPSALTPEQCATGLKLFR